MYFSGDCVLAGTFIISLDCEGMWGMADRPRATRSYITDDALSSAYDTLLALFHRYEMPVTFAFVSLFAGPAERGMEVAEAEPEMTYRGADWLQHFRAEMRAGQTDGWFMPDAYARIQAAAEDHEIGSHGYSHIPFDGEDTPPALLAAEFSRAADLAAKQGVKLETFIYPRNLVGALPAMKEAGFTGYRGRLPSNDSRIKSLLREFHIADKAQAPEAANGLCPIPAGYFLNWHSGLRKSVPLAVSRMRWRSILRDAAKQSRAAHIWAHPHNIIGNKGTLALLDSVLEEAAKLRDAGKLDVLTQKDYVARQVGA